MPRSHEQLIHNAEAELILALKLPDLKMLSNLIHPDIVYVDEKGGGHNGFGEMQILDPNELVIEDVDILEKSITFFNDIAIVYTLEKRRGLLKKMPFNSVYRLTKTWKFIGGKWMLIALSIIEL